MYFLVMATVKLAKIMYCLCMVTVKLAKIMYCLCIANVKLAKIMFCLCMVTLLAKIMYCHLFFFRDNFDKMRADVRLMNEELKSLEKNQPQKVSQ